MLIDRGADVNVPQYDGGWTPLHAAARYSEEPLVIHVLLENGANKYVEDEIGVTPCQLVVANNELPTGAAREEVIQRLCR